MRTSILGPLLVGGALVSGCVERPVGGTAGGSTGAAATGETGPPASATADATSTVSSAPTTATSTVSSAPTTGSSTGDASTAPETTTTAASTSSTSAGDTTTCNFICETTMTPPPSCDPFDQDCPDGEKCAAYSDDGGNAWNNNKCVPILGDQQPGEPCTVVESGVSGLDDCAFGAMCWDTDAENKGICVALCTGSAEAPVCEMPGTQCSISGDGILTLCLNACDPLAQDCAPADVCIFDPVHGRFLCVLDASGDEGQQHDPCELPNACDPGLQCVDAGAAVECDPQQAMCCQPFCAVSGGDAQCAGVGQECTPFYEMGMAPPGREDVGLCAIP